MRGYLSLQAIIHMSTILCHQVRLSMGIKGDQLFAAAVSWEPTFVAKFFETYREYWCLWNIESVEYRTKREEADNVLLKQMARETIFNAGVNSDLFLLLSFSSGTRPLNNKPQQLRQTYPEDFLERLTCALKGIIKDQVGFFFCTVCRENGQNIVRRTKFLSVWDVQVASVTSAWDSVQRTYMENVVD